MIPCCCVDYNRDSRCFSVGRTTPHVAPFRRGISTPPRVIHGSLGTCESAPRTSSRSVQPFLHSSPVLCEQLADRHTDHAMCDIAKRHLVHLNARRPPTLSPNQPTWAVSSSFGSARLLPSSSTVAVYYYSQSES